MVSWVDIVETHGLGDYSSSIIMIYNLYREHKGFSDALFKQALLKATTENTEEAFFQTLIQEILENTQANIGRRFLIN